MNLFTKLISKDYYISAPTIVKTNFNDEKSHQTNGAHGRLTYDLHDKNWIPHIGINNLSNCKANTKNKGYQEIMFFDWKIQPKKV